MGRYMKKSKTASEVALLEVTHAQSFSGVRTRAKTLALQRLRRSAAETCVGGDGGSYLQLRSRRLQKTPIGFGSRRHNPSPKDLNPSPGPNSKQNQSTRASSRLRQGCSANSGSVDKDGKESLDGVKKENVFPENEQNVNDSAGDPDVDASFGENLPECEGRERTTRESTPCSLIRDPDAVDTPASSTRPISAGETNIRMHNSLQRHIPTTHEMNDFFTPAEEEQQRQFIEKYNFDPVNEKPLPGRYEWEKINP